MGDTLSQFGGEEREGADRYARGGRGGDGAG